MQTDFDSEGKQRFILFNFKSAENNSNTGNSVCRLKCIFFTVRIVLELKLSVKHEDL